MFKINDGNYIYVFFLVAFLLLYCFVVAFCLVVFLLLHFCFVVVFIDQGACDNN